MFEFEDNEDGDFKLTTNRFVGARQFRFVLVVTQEIWEAVLEGGGDKPTTPRDAYESAKALWEESLREIADQEALRMDAETAVGTHTFFPSLDWLEKRRQASNA